MQVNFKHKKLFELDQDAIDVIKKTMEYLESRYDVIVKTAVEVWSALTGKEISDKREKEVEIKSLAKQIHKKQVVSGMMSEEDFARMIWFLENRFHDAHNPLKIIDTLKRGAEGSPMGITILGIPLLMDI